MIMIRWNRRLISFAGADFAAETIAAETLVRKSAPAEGLLKNTERPARRTALTQLSGGQALLTCCNNADENAEKTNLRLLKKYTHPAPLKGGGCIFFSTQQREGRDQLQPTEVAR